VIRFLTKVMLQRGLGIVPGGDALYDRLQRHVTKSTALSNNGVLLKRIDALRYAEAIVRHTGKPLTDFQPHLEIGAGWTLAIPLTFRQLGVESQAVVDHRRLARLDAVAHAAAILNQETSMAAIPMPRAGEELDGWLKRLGMEDLAPADPPYGRPDGMFGLVTCTLVLMHLAPDAVMALYAESARLLRRGGLFLATLRLDDLYAQADPALSHYNFLRYGHRTWKRWFDNPYTPLNRLRPSDHCRMIAACPFEVLDWQVSGNDAANRAALARIPVHRDFSGYGTADLTARHLVMLLRRT